MSKSQFTTIDPLILEALNLNEKRMHRIMDILHGGDTDAVPPRKVVTHRNRISSRNLIQDQQTLPNIKPQKDYVVNQYGYSVPRSKQKAKPKNRGSSLLLKSALGEVDQIIDVNDRKNKLQYQYARSIKRTVSPKASIKSSRANNQPQSPLQLQNSKPQKIEQIFKDYKKDRVKSNRIKTSQINSKDVYRLQIQQLVAELTPIDGLQESQKKMKRIKKKHNTLKKFDFKYYSKLNAAEFEAI